MGTYQDYSTFGFAENTITLSLDIFTPQMLITYENHIPWGQNKITQYLDSQKIRFHWASIFVHKTQWLHMKIIFHGDTSRLLEIWVVREIRLHWASIFVHRTCGLHLEIIFHGDKSRLPQRIDSQKIRLDWTTIFIPII